eukprot:COSAG02_NODE_9845_length_2095_cov_1.153808_3_plen_96_part_00
MDDDENGDFGCWETWVWAKGISASGWMRDVRVKIEMPRALEAERVRVLIVGTVACAPNGAWLQIRYGRHSINGACCKLEVHCSCLVLLASSRSKL